DREDDVGTFDQQQDEEERRHMEDVVPAHKEALAFVDTRRRHQSSRKPDKAVLVQLGSVFALEKKPDTRDDQEGTENKDDGVEAAQEGSAQPNQQGPHEQCPEDAPEEHTVLILRWHLERREDH